MKSRPREVYFADVTTHLGGMTYGGNKPTMEKIKNTLARAQKFAAERFENYERYYEIWSPEVAEGQMTTAASHRDEGPGSVTGAVEVVESWL